MITGYICYMYDPVTGDWSIAYDGTDGYPGVTQLAFTDLSAGLAYKFKIAASYQNGLTAESSEVEIYTCEQPSGLAVPELVATTSSSYTLKWSQPTDLGGCSLTGYKLYRNDGNGGTAFSEIDASDVNDKPTYTEHTTTDVSSGNIGNAYAFKIEALTEAGSVLSSSIEYTLANVPDNPSSAPASDSSITSASKIKVDISAVSGDGGSAILSYSLEMDDGNGGEYTVLYGDLTESMSTTYTTSDVQKGNTYRFRYRVRNAVGWSASYSPVAYIQAASVP